MFTEALTDLNLADKKGSGHKDFTFGSCPMPAALSQP
jgi:hypothetical protein